MLYVAACSSPLDNSAGFARSRFVPPPGSPNARSNSASAPSASPAAKRSRPFSMAYEASLSSTHDSPTSFPARGVDVDGLETRARARCARVRVGARARAVLADDGDMTARRWMRGGAKARRVKRGRRFRVGSGRRARACVRRGFDGVNATYGCGLQRPPKRSRLRGDGELGEVF